MAVPAEIRAVPRPKNTVVVKSGKPGPLQYAVRERARVKYIPHGNPQPINGKTIGHIVEGRFVPVAAVPEAPTEPEALSYGTSAFVRSVSQDVVNDLLDLFPPKTAFQILSFSFLKSIKPSLTITRTAAYCRTTFVSQFFPGTPLSQSSLTELVRWLGEHGSLRRQFYARRMAAISELHHIVVDGMLKQDVSAENDLSVFSRKARVKGCRDISVIYAYDLETMEPVCAEVFPGSCIDASAYRFFIRNNQLKRGIIVADKGFPPSQISQELAENPELHFLTPLRRNDERIRTNNMLEFDGVLEGIAGHVAYRKRRIKGGRFLYAFKDGRSAGIEDVSFLAKVKEKKDFDAEKYAKKSSSFGVIVLESDLDLTPREAYLCCSDRWKIRMVFRRCKNDECMDVTRVQGDFSVIGMEFINFIATLLTCRMVRKAVAAGLLDKMSYGDLMEDLSGVWRRTDGSKDPRSDDGFWARPVFSEARVSMETLGLSTPAETKVRGTEDRKKPGRPRIKPEFVGPKRRPGRPRKTDL